MDVNTLKQESWFTTISSVWLSLGSILVRQYDLHYYKWSTGTGPRKTRMDLSRWRPVLTRQVRGLGERKTEGSSKIRFRINHHHCGRVVPYYLPVVEYRVTSGLHIIQHFYKPVLSKWWTCSKFHSFWVYILWNIGKDQSSLQVDGRDLF